MGLLTDCECNPERPAITAAYQAITSLKRKCRVGIKMDGCPCLCAALEFGLDEVPEFEGVPEWSKLLEALSTHSYYLDSVWYNNPWSPDPWSLEHPLVTKVKQRAKAYLDTLT
jgi:hypothetical protein